MMDGLVGIYRHVMRAEPHASDGELATHVQGIVEATGFSSDEPSAKERFARLLLGLDGERGETRSWQQWRLRFAGYAHAMRSLLQTYSGSAFVSEEDESSGIRKVFSDLLKVQSELPYYRKAQWSAGSVLSAEYYTGRVVHIVDAFSKSHGSDGALTESGCTALLMAIDEMMSPWSFLKGLRQSHPDVIALADESAARVRHADASLAIHQFLEEVVNVARRLSPHGGSRLRAAWNTRRGAIELKDEVGGLFAFLRDDPIAAEKLRALYSPWWIEEVAGVHRMVVPTMSHGLFRMWESLMADAWPVFLHTHALLHKTLAGTDLSQRECFALDDHFKDLGRLHDDIMRISSSQVGSMTVEREVVSNFFAKVNNWLGLYVVVRSFLDEGLGGFNSEAFREEFAFMPKHSRENIFQRMTGSFERLLPNLSIKPPYPPPSIIPADAQAAHGRLDRLVYGAAQLAGGLPEDCAVELHASWDEERGAVVFDNPDGRYASFLDDVQRRPFAYPSFLTSLFDGGRAGIAIAGSQIFLPVRLAGTAG